MLSPIQELKLNHDETRLSFIYLLIFVRNHKLIFYQIYTDQ